MITVRVLSRRAWTRESGTLFTTTISYRGQTDVVPTDADTDIDVVEKRPPQKLVSTSVQSPRDTAQHDADIISLPV